MRDIFCEEKGTGFFLYISLLFFSLVLIFNYFLFFTFCANDGDRTIDYAKRLLLRLPIEVRKMYLYIYIFIIFVYNSEIRICYGKT